MWKIDASSILHTTWSITFHSKLKRSFIKRAIKSFFAE